VWHSRAGIYAGSELDAFLERHGVNYDRIIYVGDGSNDFCPALRLRRYRHIMNVVVRTNHDIVFSARTWCFVADTEHWNIVSSRKAKEEASSAKSDIGQGRGKLKKFSSNSLRRWKRARKQVR
jgi:hypothetical protein